MKYLREAMKERLFSYSKIWMTNIMDDDRNEYESMTKQVTEKTEEWHYNAEMATQCCTSWIEKRWGSVSFRDWFSIMSSNTAINPILPETRFQRIWCNLPLKDAEISEITQQLQLWHSMSKMLIPMNGKPITCNFLLVDNTFYLAPFTSYCWLMFQFLLWTGGCPMPIFNTLVWSEPLN